MKTNGLLVNQTPSYEAKRTDPGPTNGGIDMTKVMIEGFGYSKKVVGHHTRLQARGWHWLVFLNRALNCRFLHGIEGQRLTGWPATAVSRPARPHARLRRPRLSVVR